MTGRTITLISGDRVYEVRLSGPDAAGVVSLTGRRLDSDGTEAQLGGFEGKAEVRNGAVLLSGPERLRVAVARDRRGVWVGWRGRTLYLEAAGRGRPRPQPVTSGDEIRAPMTGVLVEVRVAPGAPVARDETVAVLEAMKMEYRLRAPRDGVVREVSRAAGDRVELGEPLIRLERLAPEAAEATAVEPAATTSLRASGTAAVEPGKAGPQ